MAQISLTPNQSKVFGTVGTNFASAQSINNSLGRRLYDQGGTTTTLDSLVRRGLVEKSGRSYKRKAPGSRFPVTTPSSKETPPKKEILKSTTEYWVDPSDLVINDLNGIFNDGRIFRSGDDEVTVRYESEEDQYFTLKLGDTIAALEALRDNPISRFG